jgi:phosphohistidine phosphatase SixA
MKKPRFVSTFAALLATLLSLPVILPVPARADALGNAPATAAQFVEIPATTESLKQLRKGGFVLYLRHGKTDNTRGDRVPAVDLNDCTTQRPLTEEGRQMAMRVGEAMRKAQIPVGDIRVSPLCRAKESAAAAFPKQATIVDHQLMYTANLTDAEKAPIIANTRQLLSTPVAAGSNRLLLAHAPNLMDLIGYFPKEGTVVIFQPKNHGNFEYIASIPPMLWADLLR